MQLNESHPKDNDKENARNSTNVETVGPSYEVQTSLQSPANLPHFTSVTCIDSGESNRIRWIHYFETSDSDTVISLAYNTS